MTTGKRSWDEEKAEFGRGAEPTPGLLAEEFARLARALLAGHTVAEVLEQVVSAAYRVVPGADLVSVTVRDSDGRFHTPVDTGPVALELDQVQYETGEGPCLDASRESGPAAVRADVATEPNWPKFGPAAAAKGFSTVLSTALLPDARPPQLIGALNIYSRSPGQLGERSADVALLLATHASLALATAKVTSISELKDVQLTKAMQSRDVIGQAKGILMARRGLSAEEAFDLLRRTSQDLNVKLREVAETLATRHAEIDLPGG